MKKDSQNNRKLKNGLMLAGATLAIMASLYGVGAVMADENDDRKNSLVEFLAKRFNVSEQEAESVLNEHRKINQAERQVEMKTRLEERLNQAVNDGKITEEQKVMIMEKREEMQDKINKDVDNWSQKREERRGQMEAYRKEMIQWAENNGIDTNVIGLGRMDRAGRAERCGMCHEMNF